MRTIDLRTIFLSILLGLLLSMAWFGRVSAQQEEPFPSDDDVNDVAKQMYCPVCENIPLDVCDTTACEQWRELIRQKLAEGWSEEQIKDYFVLQYGDRVLAEPPRRGLNWLVYILPPVCFLIGVFVLYRALKHMRGAPAATSDPDTGVVAAEENGKDAYIARIEEALKERRK